MSTNTPSDAAEDQVPAPAEPAEIEAEELVEDEELIEDPSGVQVVARPPAPPTMPPPAPPRIATTPAPAVGKPPRPSLDDTIDAAIAGAQLEGKERAARLSAVYEAEITALGPQSRQRQATYAHELGEIAAAQGDEGAAVKAWARALQADPSLRPNLWTVRRVFERRSMWPNALRLLEAELRFVPSSEERAELQVERGALLEDRMNDAAMARTAYEAAIKEDPMALRAFMALERRLIEEGKEPERVRENLEGLAAATRDPARRTALLIDLARLHAETGAEGLERAHEVLQQASRARGDEPGQSTVANSSAAIALEEMERLALRAGRAAWREEALQAQLEALALDDVARPPGSAADAARIASGIVLRMRLAAEAEDRGDEEGAFVHLEAAAQLATDDPSLSALVDGERMAIARATERHELVGKLAMGFASAAPEALRDIFILEAVDAFDRAALPEQSKEAQALAERAGLHEAIEVRLRRKAEREGDDETLASMYMAEAERAIADGRTAAAGSWLARAAAILGERLARPDAAITAGERALSVLPQGLTYEQHADALEWRFLRAGRYDACAQLLERRISAATDDDARDQLRLRRVRVLAERLDDSAGAAKVLGEVVARRPDDLSLRYELAMLLRRAGAVVDAATELRVLAERSVETSRKLDLLVERGALLAWQTDRVGEGEAALREALSLAPGEERAAAALEELFERGRSDPSRATNAPSNGGASAEGLVTALRAEIDANVHPERLSASLARLADLHERDRGDAAAAAAVYRELFEKSVEPQERALALRGIARCRASDAEPQTLIAALEQELELLSDDVSRATQRARIAWERERRGDTEGAEADHQHLTDLGALPAEVQAQAQLGSLRRAYRTRDRDAIADRLADLSASIDAADPAAGTMRVEYARALLERGAIDDAAEHAAKAVAAQADSYPAQLTAMAVAARRESSRDLASALSLIGEGIAEPSLRASLLGRSSVIGWLGGEATDVTLERAQLAASVQATDANRVILAEIGGDVAATSARLDLGEGQRRSAWLWSLAQGQAQQGELAAASKSLEALLSVTPNSLSALELDRRVRIAAGDKAGFAARTLAFGLKVKDAERSTVLLAEAGFTWSGLGDVRHAVFAYREALDRTPLDESTFERARALLLAELGVCEPDSARHTWAAGTFLELLDHRLAHAQAPDARVDAFVDRAELCAGVADREAAERDFRAALELRSNETRAVCGLLRLTSIDPRRIGETRELADRLASLEIEDNLRRDMHLLLADVEQREGGDPARAISALDAAVAIDEDAPVLRTLASILRAQRHWQRAIDVRRRLVPLIGPDEASPVELEVADIYLQGFADAAAAREAALRALQLDPNSRKAVQLLSHHPFSNALAPAAVLVLDRAAEAARGLLTDDSARDAAIEQLRAVAGVRGDEEQTALLGQLAALSVGRSVEPRAQVMLPTAPFGAARDLLRPSLLDSVTRHIFSSMAETVTKLYPIDTSRLGKLSKPSSKQRKTELHAFDELARLVGLPELTVELCDGSGIAADHARVVIGREALPLMLRASGRFRVVRVLTLFADGLAVLDRLDDAAIVAFVIGTLTAIKLEVPPMLNGLRPSPAVIEERSRLTDKAIKGREKKAVLALQPRLGELGDPRRFRAAALSSALRTALFVAGDLSALVGEVGPDGSGELARFAVSAAFLEARRRWREGA